MGILSMKETVQVSRYIKWGKKTFIRGDTVYVQSLLCNIYGKIVKIGKRKLTVKVYRVDLESQTTERLSSFGEDTIITIPNKAIEHIGKYDIKQEEEKEDNTQVDTLEATEHEDIIYDIDELIDGVNHLSNNAFSLVSHSNNCTDKKQIMQVLDKISRIVIKLQFVYDKLNVYLSKRVKENNKE